MFYLGRKASSVLNLGSIISSTRTERRGFETARAYERAGSWVGPQVQIGRVLAPEIAPAHFQSGGSGSVRKRTWFNTGAQSNHPFANLPLEAFLGRGSLSVDDSRSTIKSATPSTGEFLCLAERLVVGVIRPPQSEATEAQTRVLPEPPLATVGGGPSG
jgi:hypothetical protein